MLHIKDKIKVLLSLRDMKVNGKKCNCCGVIHRVIPTDHTITKDPLAIMIWFDCKCKSTLVRRVR